MILIDCPFCGRRDHAEFTYVGDATRVRPADPEQASAADWHDWVYLRDNPRGPHQELWQHTGGCRGFVRVLRDTLTHDVHAWGRPAEDLGRGTPR